MFFRSPTALAAGLIAMATLQAGCVMEPETTAEEETAITEAGLSSSVNQQLAEVRQATDKYHDVNVAIAEGYVQLGPCIEDFGVFFLKFPLVFDDTVNELTPEGLLYEPTEDGGLKLVAVSYLYLLRIDGQPWFSPAPPPYFPADPYLFGGEIRMDGPYGPHQPGQAWHWDLVAWVWSGNPDGMFATYNTNVDCQ
jgi:hypothetical protein